jgi:hypothetical protein
MVNENGLTKIQARELIKKCFSDLAADVDHGFVAKTTAGSSGVAEIDHVSRDILGGRNSRWQATLG